MLSGMIIIVKIMNNTPTLMDSEEKRAPWNEETKLIEVTVSQMLSSLVWEMNSPNYTYIFDIYDENRLKDVVREQIYLPSDVINENSPDCWYVDDFCVMI